MSRAAVVRLPAAVAWVALGGAVGTYARVVVSVVVDPELAATLTVNVVGAFALGVLLTWLADGGRRRHRARLLLGTGFCGGFTTYSLVALQVVALARAGDTVGVAGYVGATLLLGGIATLLGIALGTWLRSRRGRVIA